MSLGLDVNLHQEEGKKPKRLGWMHESAGDAEPKE